MNDTSRKQQTDVSRDPRSLEGLDVTEVATKSPLLARLIEEVRNEQVDGPHVYDRMHNRHNRSR